MNIFSENFKKLIEEIEKEEKSKTKSIKIIDNRLIEILFEDKNLLKFHYPINTFKVKIKEYKS